MRSLCSGQGISANSYVTSALGALFIQVPGAGLESISGLASQALIEHACGAQAPLKTILDKPLTTDGASSRRLRINISLTKGIEDGL